MSDVGEPKTGARLFRGYGPLFGLVAVIVLVATFLPTKAQEIRVEQVTVPSGVLDGDTTQVLGEAVEAPVDGAEAGPNVAPTGDPAATVGESTAPAGGGTKQTRRVGQEAIGSAPGASASAAPVCAGRPRQIAGDPYAPPCRDWAGGDNGGTTASGVTTGEILVSVRIDAFLGGLTDALAKAAGARDLKEDPKVVERTLDALTEYFNRTYQFYGRRIRLQKFDGNGDLLKEALGSGQEGAEQDAIRVASELKSFADISAISQVYSDALSRRKIVNIGALYPSKQWLRERRPYAWTALADCAVVTSSVTNYYVARLAGKPAAFAGGDLRDKPRRMVLISPDNRSYNECVDVGVENLRSAGFGNELADRLTYPLDLNQMASQAAALTPKIKASGATTIVCACDPIMLVFLTSKVREQGMEPEWVNTGIAYSDQDLVGQLLDPGSWKRSFGVSLLGETVPLRGSIAYAAYKQIRPNDEPSVVAELVYYQLQLLAIGLQMAGPNLTPETFEQGMFDYPASTGRAGLWNFGPNDYSGPEDAREIYWVPDAASVQNGERGAYAETMPGRRFAIGQWPVGDPAVPRR